ncbi:MAG: very short patch repair endonuclease [Flavobacterium sp.]|nr:MAG: very short patch repair endonuclease [Flavobacterium sp.]
MMMEKPKPLNSVASATMKANVSKNTKPEILFRKMLRLSGLSGYRINWKKAAGRPDIAYPSKKIAIFINGCFWHRCKKCNPKTPKNNYEYWQSKFIKNVRRDIENESKLLSSGWKVYTIWECELKQDLTSILNDIKDAYKLF